MYNDEQEKYITWTTRDNLFFLCFGRSTFSRICILSFFSSEERRGEERIGGGQERRGEVKRGGERRG
jgi:hypothetical protein